MIEKLIKIVCVEDNDFDFELVVRKLQTLGFKYSLVRVMIEEELKYLLEKDCPDLILSDFSLPSFSGLEALKIAKNMCPSIPFIFVSGTIGEELAVETLIQGANDYVLKDNLTKLGPAITRALSEAKEKSQRKIAEEKLIVKIDELKSLVHRISHDIRGPVCTVKGLVNLIEQSESKSMNEILDYVRMIGQVNMKLEGIISNLSSYQFIYSDKIKNETIKAEDLLKKLKTAISKIDGNKDVDFQLTSNGLKQCISESQLLFSVIYNLIFNAFVFRDKNKPKHKVVCALNFTENEISLLVEDNGIGIPDSIKDRIWDMFYRGSTLSRGAGIGLNITKTILEKLNGKFILDSKENIGTKIQVSIPSGK